MTIRVEVTKIPNSNQNTVSSYDENIINGKTKRTLNRKFIVPQENTDEFVNKIKKSEKNKIITTGLSFIAGAGIALGIGLNYLKKNPKLDYTILGIATFAAGIIAAVIPAFISNCREKNLFKNLNIEEIK